MKPAYVIHTLRPEQGQGAFQGACVRMAPAMGHGLVVGTQGGFAPARAGGLDRSEDQVQPGEERASR